jgi:hypothetical protein
MLEVTFKNLLPNEGLLGIAHEGYAQLRRRAGDAADALRCRVVIRDEPALGERFHVGVEVLCGRETALRTQTQSRSAQGALRHGMLAANMAAADLALCRDTPQEQDAHQETVSGLAFSPAALH